MNECLLIVHWNNTGGKKEEMGYNGNRIVYCYSAAIKITRIGNKFHKLDLQTPVYDRGTDGFKEIKMLLVTKFHVQPCLKIQGDENGGANLGVVVTVSQSEFAICKSELSLL